MNDTDLLDFIVLKTKRVEIFERWISTPRSELKFTFTDLEEAFWSGMTNALRCGVEYTELDVLASELRLLLVAELMESDETLEVGM